MKYGIEYVLCMYYHSNIQTDVREARCSILRPATVHSATISSTNSCFKTISAIPKQPIEIQQSAVFGCCRSFVRGTKAIGSTTILDTNSILIW